MSMKHIMGPNSTSVLTGVQDGDVQPNAVDLRVGKIFRINAEEVFEISNEHKKHRGAFPVNPDADGYFFLEPGEYEVVMENQIGVGAGESGFVITRSTLNRNGLFITSGLYDSKYHGSMAGVLHVTCGPARIQKGTRIGQYLSFDAEMLHEYSGDYGFDQSGAPKAMEAKYHK
jgi:deoxycytidine triphosphate deaminase